jgi:hypothetical protein
MRKVFAILFIGVFLLAQYGNVLSYVYCKWKSETVAASCDCEKRFSADTKSSDHPVQITLKDKLEDPYIKTDILSLGKYSCQISSRFSNNVFSLAEGFKSSPLRPPSVV